MTQQSKTVVVLFTAMLLFTVGVVPVAAGFGSGADAAASGLNNQQNDQPTAAFSYSPQQPKPGQAVTLNASASSDPDGDITEYRWDLDGDGQTDTTGGPNARVAFPSAGVYQVTLTVVDNDGATASVTNEIVVQGDIPPKASLSVSKSQITVGEVVTLNATGSSDPDGQLVSWAFDLYGNGTFDRTFESPPIFRTNYEDAGTFQVTLEVTDNDGLTDTATVELVVQETTPDTVTQTVTVTGTSTATTATTDVGTGPNAGGGPGLIDRFPGGGLGLGALIVLLLLVIGGGALYARGSGGGRPRGGGARRSQGQSGGGPILGVVIALVLTLLLIAGPVALLRGRGGSLTSAGMEMSMAFFELAALFIPALMLLLFVWFQLPQQLSQRGDATVGALSAAGFRIIGLALGFLALVLVVVGLAGLLLTLSLPSTIAVAGGLIIGAVGLTAFALAIATVSMAMG
ncbi:MAG: PKD domain-containing protein [Halobacteriales archaeon]